MWGGCHGIYQSNVLTEGRFAARQAMKTGVDAKWKSKYTELGTRATHTAPSG